MVDRADGSMIGIWGPLGHSRWSLGIDILKSPALSLEMAVYHPTIICGIYHHRFLLVNWLVLDEMFTVGKGRIIGGRIILFLGCLLQPVYLCISISSDYNTISMIKLIINPHITAPITSFGWNPIVVFTTWLVLDIYIYIVYYILTTALLV